MAKKTVSARGVTVNFDLMKIKEQMATTPVSIDVQKRQNFIENRLRRRAKKKHPVIPPEPTSKSTPEMEIEPEIATVEEAAPMIEQPAVEEPTVEEKKVAPKKKATPKKKTTQKARPKAKPAEDTDSEAEAE